MSLRHPVASWLLRMFWESFACDKSCKLSPLTYNIDTTYSHVNPRRIPMWTREMHVTCDRPVTCERHAIFTWPIHMSERCIHMLCDLMYSHTRTWCIHTHEPDVFTHTNLMYSHTRTSGIHTHEPDVFTHTNLRYSHTRTSCIHTHEPHVFTHTNLMYSHPRTWCIHTHKPDVFTPTNLMYSHPRTKICLL